MHQPRLTAITALIFAAAFPAFAQIPAFPGALGNGGYVTGGRNGTVYHVTTLADSGPGSFRDAVNGSGRTIVFDVGGTIKLLTAVSAKGDLTIAGQTAPGGIKFDGGEISFSSRSNIICRFIRVRPGSDTADSTDDCIAFANGRRMIFDHVSMEFGPWNNVGAVSSAWQTTPVTDITFQHCIDANPTGQQFGAHTESVNSDWTWCYNIFANSHNRNPLAKVNNVFINNIEYNNSAGYTTHTSTKFKHDIVNNYFVAGPASSGNFPWYQIDNNQSMYFTGNLYDSDKNGVLGGGTTVPLPGYQGGGTILSTPWSPWTSIIPTMSTPLAWRYGLSAAGAFPRDEVDALVIGQMKTLGSGTAGTGAGTAGPSGGLYTSQTQTGLGNNGYGTLTALTAPTDTDNDGMPDFWELATGSNPNSASPLTNTLSGYTLLENYLNFLAAPHGVTQSNTPVTINLRRFTEGFAPSATFSVTNATNGTISLQNGTNAVFTPTGNFTGLGGFTFVVTEGIYSLNVTVTVCVTPVVAADGATAFNGALIGVSITTAAVPLPSNLLWRGDGTANAWNTTASNWLNNAAAAVFKNNDVVTFDDTGSNTPNIAISSALTPGAMLFNHTKSYTLSGAGGLNGSSSLTKTGTGTLTIGTTNTGFSGPIGISDGKLELVSGASLGSGAITLADGGILNVLGGGSGSVVSGSITVPGGDNVTIGSGQLATTFGGSLISSNIATVINLSNGVSFSGTSSSQFNSFIGTVNIPSGATLRFSANSGGNTFGSLNPNFIINGTLQPRNAGNTITLGALNGSGQLTGPQTTNTGTGATVYNIGGKNQDATFTGTIVSNLNSFGSAICLNKLGTGTQILTGNNTYGGTNGVLAGTLLINGTNRPWLTAVSSNATLGGFGVINGSVRINPGGILAPGSGGPGTLTINGNLTNNSPILNFDLSGSPGGNNDRVAMSGTLAMTGTQMFNFNLTDNALGEGTYMLIDGANNSTEAGVALGNNLLAPTRQTITMSRPAAGSNPSYIQMDVSGTAGSLVWSGTNGSAWDTSTINWLNGVVADQFYNLDLVRFDDTSTNGSVTLSTLVQPASLSVSNTARAYDFSGTGALSGSGPLNKSGSGALTINTTNSAYTGSIFLSGGTLAAGGPSSLGGGSLTISGGSVLTLPASGTVFYGGPVTIPADTAATVSSSALANGFSGKLFSGNNNSVLNIVGGVSFSGTTAAQFDNFTGTVNIQAGATLRYSSGSSGNTFGSLAPTLVINGTLQPRNAGNTVVLGTISGSGALAGPQSNNGTGDTLYVIGRNNSDSTFGGNISSNSAVADSAVSLTKSGTGVLTLTGASTYTGGTTVESGTLRVNNVTGSGTGTGDLEIFSDAKLTGTGFIGSSTTVDGDAILAPGDPVGTLTFADNLTLSDSSLLQFALGATSDRVAVGGSLFLAGELFVTNAPGFGPGTYTLFTCSGSLTFDNLVLAGAPAGYNYALSTNTPGQVDLIVSTITPPSFSAPVYSGGNLILSGTGGTSGANYYVLTSTNLASPMADWTPLVTNQFDGSGNFAFTNAVSAGTPRQFYRVQVP